MVQVDFLLEWLSSHSSTSAVSKPGLVRPNRPNKFAGVPQPELAGAPRGEALTSRTTSSTRVPVREFEEKLAVAAHVTKLTSPVSDPRIHVSEEEKWTEDLSVDIVKLEEKYGVLHKSGAIRCQLFSRGSCPFLD